MAMLYEVMRSIKNFFADNRSALHGEFTVADGDLPLSSVPDGQYVLLRGSVFNDGVYQAPLTGLTDEVFTGDVVPLRIPPDFLSLVGEIEAWQEKNAEATESPFQSESFGGYSYTRATGKDGSAVSWKDAFATRLNVWRKV